ncbi:MAG: hypothetical protein KDE15_04230 [Erythrobacter sp.]|nr:hypothetical protein [Erythrobacter sp.]
MTEQRTTEIETPSGNSHTTTTIITDEPRSGGAGKWIALLGLLVVAALAFVVFTQMSDAQIARDNAVAEAADSVGDAANQVGDAAQNVGEAAQDAIDSATN